MEDSEVWRLSLELLRRNSHGKAGNEEEEEEFQQEANANKT